MEADGQWLLEAAPPTLAEAMLESMSSPFHIYGQGWGWGWALV